MTNTSITTKERDKHEQCNNGHDKHKRHCKQAWQEKAPQKKRAQQNKHDNCAANDYNKHEHYRKPAQVLRQMSSTCINTAKDEHDKQEFRSKWARQAWVSQQMSTSTNVAANHRDKHKFHSKWTWQALQQWLRQTWMSQQNEHKHKHHSKQAQGKHKFHNKIMSMTRMYSAAMITTKHECCSKWVWQSQTLQQTSTNSAANEHDKHELCSNDSDTHECHSKWARAQMLQQTSTRQARVP